MPSVGYCEFWLTPDLLYSRAKLEQAVAKPKRRKENPPESSLHELRLDVPLSNRPKYVLLIIFPHN